ncbi:MAG: DUF4158 domain-containing protein [Actinobacteria bacterium]|nr:DUF4158 domain-containing protein [Actinomycetota bacterium]MCA1700788.1 DUF4158 domain-containing protein [Actinomycetota bacterium]
MTPGARVLRFPAAVGAMGAGATAASRASCPPTSWLAAFSSPTMTAAGSRPGAACQPPRVRRAARHRSLPRPPSWRTPPTSPRASWTASEIAVPGDTSLEQYGAGEARWEHQTEIRTAYSYRQFGDHGVDDELVLWLRARAWVSAENHRVLFARAAEHLIARRILLPGYSILWRLVGAAREHADARGYRPLADTATAVQCERLAALLRTPAGRRLSVLERLRRPEVEPTIGGLIDGLARVRELRLLADGLGGLDALPVARLRADRRRRALPPDRHREDERRAQDRGADSVRDHRDIRARQPNSSTGSQTTSNLDSSGMCRQVRLIWPPSCGRRRRCLRGCGRG